jgi:hypothetical protein
MGSVLETGPALLLVCGEGFERNPANPSAYIPHEEWHVARVAIFIVVVSLMVAPGFARPSPDGWRDNLESVRIPESPARGRIRGQELKVDRAELRGSHLYLRQGKEFFADREFVILMSGPQAALQGKKFNITEDQEMGGPHVHMSWKQPGSTLPKTKIILGDYIMRLELGRIRNGRLPGKIYLCIPDFKRSYVAGRFDAAIK